MKTRSLNRRGFTITELLVVSTILMSLFGLVLSGGRITRRTDGDIRRGAQQFASVLLASQSLSLGNPTGSAVIIDSQGAFGETFSQARRFPFIEGIVTEGMPPANPNATSHEVKLQPTNDEPRTLEHGYKIRFFERSAGTDGPVTDWFSLSCASPPIAEVRLRKENGQTTRTALWPSGLELKGDVKNNSPLVTNLPTTANLEVGMRVEIVDPALFPDSNLLVSTPTTLEEIVDGTTVRLSSNAKKDRIQWSVKFIALRRFQAARYPIPTGQSQTLPDGVAIDLRHSGYGDADMTDWGQLDGRGALGVGFDPVGSVDSLMQNVLPPEGGPKRTVQPITPNEQVYFFVTFRSEIEDPDVDTLASEKALWVVLHPRTGRVTIAPNVPPKASSTNPLRDAREKARQGLSIEG